MRVSVRELSRDKLPSLPLIELSASVLGRFFVLSLVTVGERRSRNLNRAYRGKNGPTNILSFSLGAKEGELVLNVYRARAEARRLKVAAKDYLLYLVAHGMLHLKGYDHGTRMEMVEQKHLQPFVSKSFLEWLAT